MLALSCCLSLCSPSLVASLVEVPLDLLNLLQQLADLVEPALEELVLDHAPPMLGTHSRTTRTHSRTLRNTSRTLKKTQQNTKQTEQSTKQTEQNTKNTQRNLKNATSRTLETELASAFHQGS